MPDPDAFEPTKILEALLGHEVACIVIGGIAGAFYGSPYPTGDVDICPSLDAANLERLASALKELEATAMAGDEPGGLKLDFTGPYLMKLLLDFQILNLSTKYGQLDLLYRPAGTEGYSDLARRASHGSLGGELQVVVASLDDVIRSKQAAGRDRDLIQLPTLKKLRDRRRTRDE